MRFAGGWICAAEELLSGASHGRAMTKTRIKTRRFMPASPIFLRNSRLSSFTNHSGGRVVGRLSGGCPAAIPEAISSSRASTRNDGNARPNNIAPQNRADASQTHR